jgi:hypothetical protein
MVAVLGAVGCGDGGSEASPEDETTTSAATATTQPPATDEASHEIVNDMVLEATGLADELFQDPELIDDPDDETFDRLQEIYTPDSPAAAAIEDLLRGMVDEGQHQRPSATGLFREVTVYAFEAVDADTLTFDTCNQIDKETVNDAGDVVTTDAQMVFVGGEARRIDGVWRFVGLSNDATRANPMTPGSSERGRCAQFTDGMESR